MEPIFRASQHGFKASDFHSRCDNIENTLVLLRNEYGKTLGGYTPVKWNAASSTHAADPSLSSFIFSVDLKEKFVNTDEDKLMYCGSYLGPTFGGGHDIYIADKCNSNNNSYTNFPSSYNRGSGEKLVRDQSSWLMFAGVPSGYKMRIVEYEVFHVQF